MLVTGASSGIGRETAILLSQLGARVVLVARNPAGLEQTRSLLEGPDHRVEPRDLAALNDIPGWLQGLSRELGAFSGLVHCAGLQMTLPLRLVTVQQLKPIIEINLTAAIMLAKGLRQKEVHTSPASLVLLSSAMGLVGSAGRSVYSASKSALLGLARSLAIELAGEGLRVNCVAPAFVNSEMLNDLKRRLRPEQLAAIESAHPLGIGHVRDVAHAIAFLVADTGRWITGTTLAVDGGYTAQ
jgi:NAD(P)-dependent dehydrogenase (short-subunit alcohol dehydrogenase family)